MQTVVYAQRSSLKPGFHSNAIARKRKPQEFFTQQTQAAANRNARSKAVATMIGCLPTQALAFLAVFVYATQAIAFEWKPGFTGYLKINIP